MIDPWGRCFMLFRSIFLGSNRCSPWRGLLLLFSPSGIGSAASVYKVIKKWCTSCRVSDGSFGEWGVNLMSKGQKDSPFCMATLIFWNLPLPKANSFITPRLHTGCPRSFMCRAPLQAAASWFLSNDHTLEAPPLGKFVTMFFRTQGHKRMLLGFKRESGCVLHWISQHIEFRNHPPVKPVKLSKLSPR